MFKNFLFAGLGILAEWYDFFLYVALNKFWLDIFFHGYSLATAQIYIMCIYLLAYFGRLVGGSFLASYSDRYGRKVVFLLSSVMMTGCSLLIALLPIHQLPQVAGIILFALLRFLQGCSVGAESPAGQAYVFEHGWEKYKATSVAICSVFSSLGLALATTVVYLVLKIFTYSDIIQFAWRIPYIISVIIGGCVFFVRREATETREFLKIGRSASRKPFATIMKSQKKSLIAMGILAALCGNVCYHFLTSGNILLIYYFHYTESQLLKAGIISSLSYVVIDLLIALLVDISNNLKYCLYVGWVIPVVIIFPYYFLFYQHSISSYIQFASLIDVSTGFTFYSLFIYLGSRVSTDCRVSVLTLFYNGQVFSSSILVVILTVVINYFNKPMMIPIIFCLLSVVSAFGIFYILFYNKKSNAIRDVGSESEHDLVWV